MVAGLILITALFFNDNAEFINKANEQIANGANWEYVGLQDLDPNALAIPLINQDTGKESIIFKLSNTDD
tara:strand:+ start:2451 stop:2660 length:210 start_codon:yes stop_codon:yes gene_type:complete